MILSDTGILDRIARPDDDPHRLRISDFVPELRKPDKRPSYGLSCAGYDCRLAGEFAYLDRIKLAQSGRAFIEPGEPAPWVPAECPFWVLEPGEFVLARTMEYIRMPRDCSAQVFGKSTWARNAICLNTTLIEPEWEGTVTLEISNIGNFPVMLRAGVGICQIVFSRIDPGFPVRTSYADRASPTYMKQRGVTLARV